MAYRKTTSRNEEDDSTAESTARNNGGSSDEAVGAIADKVDLLVNALQNTNSNLRSVDRLLDTYRTLNEQQTVALDRVRDDVERVASRAGASSRGSNTFINEDRDASPTRQRNVPLRATEQFSANNEMRKFMSVPRGASEPKTSIRNASASLGDVRNAPASSLRDQVRSTTSSSRFVNTQGPRTISSSQLALSDEYESSPQDEVQRALRDLASEQSRVRHELDAEARARHVAQSASASELNLRDLVDRLRRDELVNGTAGSQPDSAAIEKQLAEINQELRSARNKRSASVASPTRGLGDQPNVSSALKSALEAHQGLTRATSSAALMNSSRTSFGYQTAPTAPVLNVPPGGYAALASFNNVQLPFGATHSPQHHHASMMNLTNAYPMTSATPTPLGNANVPIDSSNEAYLKSKILQLERQKIEFENEVEGLKRKLAQAESVRQVMQKQLDESQSQLQTAERERARVRTELGESREEAERKAQKAAKEIADERSDERRKYEREISALRQRIEQLVASSAAELNEARREQDRLTFAHKHASEQIASLRNDLEARDRTAAKQTVEVQERDAKRSALERQVAELQTRIAAQQDELRQAHDAHARLADKLKSAENVHSDAIRNENDARQKAHDQSKQLKSQLAKAEKDMEDARRRHAEMARRCDSAAAENEQLRRQVAHIQVTFEQLKHEFDNLLTIRGKQEEAIRAKDDEIDRLRSDRSEFENSAEAARRGQEKAEQHARALEHETNAMREEHARVQEKLTSVEAARRVLDDQLKSYQAELKQAQMERSQLLTTNQQLTVANNELRTELADQTTREKSAREELATLTGALDQEKEKHNTALIRLTREIEAIKAQERRILEDAAKTFKEQESGMVKQLSKLNSELNEVRKHGRAFQVRCEQQQVDMMNMHERLIKAEQEVQATQRKYRKLSDWQKERLAHERGSDETERSFKDRIAALERERNMLMETVAVDVDRLVAKADSQTLFSSFRSDSFGIKPDYSGNMDVSAWLADLKAKLSHVHAELERLREVKERLEMAGSAGLAQLPDDDTGYTSASPLHSVSASANDPLSAASSMRSPSNLRSRTDTDSTRKLEAIESEISVLLRDLDENRKKQRAAPPLTTDTKVSRSPKHTSNLRNLDGDLRTSAVNGSTKYEPSLPLDDSPSASSLLEKQRIVNRYSRLHESVQALKDDLASDDALGLSAASRSAYRPLLAASRKAQTGAN